MKGVRRFCVRLGVPCLLLALSGCGYYDARQARDPLGAESMVGMSVVDLVDCAGVPDHVLQTGPDTAVAQWDYKAAGSALKATIAVLGSLEFGAGESCKLVATVLREGIVADVAFPGSRASVTSGPYAGCSVIVGECLDHPSRTTLPAGYDAWTWFVTTGGKRS
jgi:hypothetical protein